MRFPLNHGSKRRVRAHCLFLYGDTSIGSIISQITLPLSQRFKSILLCVVEHTTGNDWHTSRNCSMECPVLNGNKPRPRLRVPSGNIQIDRLSLLIRRASSVIVLCALERFSRSRKILPVTQYKMPKKESKLGFFTYTYRTR